jgi:hypothetical protein
MADIKVVIAGSLDSGIIRLGLEIHGSGGHTTDLTPGKSAGHIRSCWSIRRMRNADIRSQRSSTQNEELGCIQLASNLGTTLVDGAECCRLCFPLLKAFFFCAYLTLPRHVHRTILPACIRTHCSLQEMYKLGLRLKE